MSYESKVFNIMIASPSDVLSEREIIRKMIYKWNEIHSFTRKIVLLPIGWETHSSPEMGNHPQSIINKRLLEKCDILVGVFKTRVGTPTENYISGTVEEIEEHLKKDKLAMIYFSKKELDIKAINDEQQELLTKFKSSLSQRGIYSDYGDQNDFKDKFFDHLQLQLNEHNLFKDINPQSVKEVVVDTFKVPILSNKAKLLLKEVSLDKNGIIMFYQSMSNDVTLQTNKKSLISSFEKREIVEWKKALEELISQRFIVDKSGKFEYFEITADGYELADIIDL